ncbi:MAG: type II secretion system minor pseudopilin GspI [Granulosicoccus sp.]|nr:type II secretion system minor pseudopilin GspI [Granulosicoccus sp.]
MNYRSRCSRHHHRVSIAGFTLVEILVAMTIIAVGVSALVSSAGASAWRAEQLREREFGRWVSSNVLTELQVRPAWPDVGTTNTEVEMGDSLWYVRTVTQKVADPDLRRVDVQVRRDKDADNYVYVVTGFVGNPSLRQTGGGQNGPVPSGQLDQPQAQPATGGLAPNEVTR